MQQLKEILTLIINYAILAFDFYGAGCIIFSGARFIYDRAKHNPAANEMMMSGFQTALEILMGAEILRTVVVHELSEIFIIAGIFILRAAFSFINRFEKREGESDRSTRYSLYKNRTERRGRGDD